MTERLDLPADPSPPEARWRRKGHLVEELRGAARRRRRRRRAAIVLVPVAALGLVAAAVIASSSLRVTTHLGCYAGPSVEADTTVVDADGRLPTAICAELWARGEVDPATRTAPPLEACVLRTGPVGVFPADPPGCASGSASATGRSGSSRAASPATGHAPPSASWSASARCS